MITIKPNLSSRRCGCYELVQIGNAKKFKDSEGPHVRADVFQGLDHRHDMRQSNIRADSIKTEALPCANRFDSDGCLQWGREGRGRLCCWRLESDIQLWPSSSVTWRRPAVIIWYGSVTMYSTVCAYDYPREARGSVKLHPAYRHGYAGLHIADKRWSTAVVFPVPDQIIRLRTGWTQSQNPNMRFDYRTASSHAKLSCVVQQIKWYYVIQ